MNALAKRQEFTSDQVVQVPFSADQIRGFAVLALMRCSGSGPNLHEIEDIKDPGAYRSYSLIGTVLEPAVRDLQSRGVMTNDTLGELQDALDFNDGEMHFIACDCGHGPTSEYKMTGQRIGLVPLLRQAAQLSNRSAASTT